MKRLATIIGVLSVIILTAYDCSEETREANFEDMTGVSIYDYILDKDTADNQYGKFRQILDGTGVGMIVSAYNPYSTGYTMFLPTDDAVDEFIANSSYSSVEDLIADQEYATILAKYHVVNMAIDANDFPFGALPARTLSYDLLTVSFVLGEDSAYYNINNQAPVLIKNQELSNGFIHTIGKMLLPITFTSYDWISNNDGYSITKEIIDMTGFDEVLSRNLKEDTLTTAVTLLMEPDTVYNKKGIYNVQDLLDTLGVTATDYTEIGNGLYQYVGYHILDANAFMDDFLDEATNYTTFSNLPLHINGKGLDIAINKGKQVFDTIIDGDTTFIDYITFNYDASNVITQSGAIHIIDRVMTLQEPNRAIVTFEFYEEPLFNEFREEPGEYIVENPDALRVISWVGPDLLFVEEADEEHAAWGDDYLKLDGDFSITYQLPKIVQGEYEVHIRTHAFRESNALIEVYIDGKKLGGLVDLSEGGSSSWPYHDFLVATIDFSRYETHTVELRSLIPGILEWDYVRFEPVTD